MGSGCHRQSQHYVRSTNVQCTSHSIIIYWPCTNTHLTLKNSFTYTSDNHSVYVSCDAWKLDTTDFLKSKQEQDVSIPCPKCQPNSGDQHRQHSKQCNCKLHYPQPALCNNSYTWVPLGKDSTSSHKLKTENTNLTKPTASHSGTSPPPPDPRCQSLKGFAGLVISLP